MQKKEKTVNNNEKTVDAKDFGKLIRRKRLAREISQKGLAKEAGISRRTIWKAESGKGIQVPKPKQILMLAIILDLRVSGLLDSLGFREINPEDKLIIKEGKKHFNIFRKIKLMLFGGQSV